MLSKLRSFILNNSTDPFTVHGIARKFTSVSLIINNTTIKKISILYGLKQFSIQDIFLEIQLKNQYFLSRFKFGRQKCLNK